MALTAKEAIRPPELLVPRDSGSDRPASQNIPHPRILHCLRAPVGGLFRHVLDLSAEQASRGYAVGLLAGANTSNALTKSKLDKVAPHLQLGITFIPMHRAPGLGDATAIWSTLATARRVGANIVHGHGAKGGLYARLAAGLGNTLSANHVACFYTPHGGSLHFSPSSLQGRIIAKTESILSRLTDGLIFESEYAARIFSDRFGQPQCSTRTIANGLQPADFTPVEPHTNAADFVFVGELRQLKGVDVLLEALARLNKTQAVRAVIVGDGPDASVFKAQASALGLADNAVIFPGALPASQAFPMGRCLVLPSRAESLPYVVLEAAAAELPIIATNVGGIPEIVTNSTTQLIPAGNVDALHDAMLTFLKNPEAASQQVHVLKASVQSRFSVSNMTSGVLDFYKDALNKP